ncbi:MAG: hypothetical protein ACTSVZ_12420 [Promethearchaeota archaeon]
MPVEVGVLLILILLIRILRRWRRWGPVKVSHVSQEKWILGGYSGEIYYNRLETNFLNPQHNAEIQKKFLNLELNKESTKKSPRILYISPLSFNFVKFHPIPTSLAVMGFDVVCLSPAEFYRIIRLESSPRNFFQNLITTNSVESVICFDHAWSACVKFLLGKNEKFPSLNYIVLRPTGSWKEIKSLTQLILHPLQFLSKIHLLKNMAKNQENGEKREKGEKGEKQDKLDKLEKRNTHSGFFSLEEQSKFGNFNTMLFINPKSTWLTDQGQEEMNSWIEQLETQYGKSKIQTFQFSEGDWWFYRNETVVLGLIARILYQ